ncbi:MAG: ferritin-like fold-containing protein [Candidatus Nanopelagicales bacterium]
MTTPSAETLENDPEYRSAIVDLLGLLAMGELMAFERLATDAALAPLIEDKIALARLATSEFQHFEDLRQRIEVLGADPDQVMLEFRKPLDEFHAHTAPSDWLEGMVKAYVGEGIASDFYREIANLLDGETRTLVLRVCDDFEHQEFIVDRVRLAIQEDPKVAGRLALWGRRLVGEALSQSQRVAAEHDSLSVLIVGGVDRPGADLAEIGRMLARLTENHARRMTALGLAA